MDVSRILQEASILFYMELFCYDSGLRSCYPINKIDFFKDSTYTQENRAQNFCKMGLTSLTKGI